mgnify:CR=1 FL=1
MNLLEVKNLTKAYSQGSLLSRIRITAADNVSFNMRPAEIFTLAGESGCGKTTILRMITGFEEVSSGKIIYAGKVINDVIPQKRDFGIVFQSYALFPNMTVHQNVAFGLAMRKMPKKLIRAVPCDR